MKSVAALLFVLLWGFFSLFHPGRTFTVDGAVSLDTVRSMGRGRLDVPETLVTRPGRGGLHYSLYGPLLALVSLPGYALGSTIDPEPPGPGSRVFGWGDRFALATNQWVSAAIGAVLFLAAREFGNSARRSTTFAVAACLSTMVLPYSRDFFTQPLAALLVLLAGYFLLSTTDGRGERVRFASGCAFGLAILARMDMGILLPGFLVWIGIEAWGDRSRVFRSLRAFAVPVLGCLALLLLFDRFRWGSWAGAPYGDQRFDRPLVDTIPRLLFSPELSVLLYNPLLVPSFLATPFLWKERKALCLGIAAMNLCYLVLVGKYNDFHGGLCPGPRYLLALVPIGLLPLAAALGTPRAIPAWLIAALCLCFLVGLGMNGYEVSVDYTAAPRAREFWTALLSPGP